MMGEVCGWAARRVRAWMPSFTPVDGFVETNPRLGDEAAEPFGKLRAGSGAPALVAPMVWPSHCLGPGSCFFGSKVKGPPWLGRSTVQPVRIAERAVTLAWWEPPATARG